MMKSRSKNTASPPMHTTAFKTVRFDELTMQRHGINVESFDLSELFEFVRAKSDSDEKVIEKKKTLEKYNSLSGRRRS